MVLSNRKQAPDMKEKLFKIFAAYQDNLVHNVGERNEDDLSDPNMKEGNVIFVILT
jgi:hypothetical protein